MQAQIDVPGGQTYFNAGSPKKKGKKTGKKNVRKTEKKGSGSLAAFGVMPQGQTTLAEEIRKATTPKKWAGTLTDAGSGW